ncbi:hypothetical protein LB505_005900 [Fusarium chuoi]|nr:hypothetical protein LB505_005900 [Fusarium chuoi]
MFKGKVQPLLILTPTGLLSIRTLKSPRNSFSQKAMSSGVQFTALPEPSEVGNIWKNLQQLIDDLNKELRQIDEYYEFAVNDDNHFVSGIRGEEHQAQLSKLHDSMKHTQALERDLRFYLKQQRKLAESSMSRIAEQLGTLNVESMARAIQASEMSKTYYEKPIEPLFETITESPLEYTPNS